MTLAIILTGIVLLVTNAVTGFLVLKGVHLGLRWQVEVRQERPPTMETPKPFETIQMFTHPNTKEKEASSLMDEWVNGAKE